MPMTATVLVIEDDDDLRAILHLLLQDDSGYTVVDAAGSASALAILRTTPQRLVVLFDYRMPCLDGEALLTLAEQAQEQVLTERHAFVCMSGVDQVDLPTTLMTLLARYDVPLVAKPFDLDTLLVVIRQAEQRLAERSVPPAADR